MTDRQPELDALKASAKRFEEAVTAMRDDLRAAPTTNDKLRVLGLPNVETIVRLNNGEFDD